IPVPGTLHQLPADKKKKSKDETLSEMDLHQTPVLGVACLFPEGHGAEADDFINRLKGALATSAQGGRLDAGLMNPWAPGQINPNAWKKAASLSGANFLFVLAPKKDKDLFKEVARVVHKDEVRARVVFLEQVPLRALYADLLADVLRSFNVKG